MALTPYDMANLVRADLIPWYANNQPAFRQIGRREYLRLLKFGAPTPSQIANGGAVVPSPSDVADAVELMLPPEQVFIDAFKRSSPFNMWLNKRQRALYAGPLARYMLDTDKQWIIY